MNIIRMTLYAWLSVVSAYCAMGQELKVWDVPRGATLEKRDGWKAAGAGGAFTGGAAVENGRILLFVKPDSTGLTLAAAGDPATAVELLVVSDKGEAGTVAKVELAKRDENGVVLRISMGAMEASVRVATGNSSVEVSSAKGGAAVEVKGRMRYAVLPDFFGNDVVFVPARYKGDRIAVAAENFLMHMLDGGNGIVTCAWQGALPSGKNQKAEGKDPAVDLFFAGEGGNRVVEKSRIEFAGKPVFVALMAGKGIWFEQDVGAEPAQKPVALKWKRPFEAKWRVDFINKEGVASRDLLTKLYTWDATYRSECPDGGADLLFTRGGKPVSGNSDLRPEQNGIPMCIMLDLFPYYVNPAWIDDCTGKDNGKMFVAMYADAGERRAVGAANARRQAEARRENKAFVPAYPSNVFERVLVYPIDRRRQTPITEVVFTDVMRESLGQGPCGYVLDLEGIKGMPAGGSRETLATCGTWNQYIGPLVQVTKGKGATVNIGGKTKKFAGLKAGQRFAARDEAFLVEKLEDLVLFITAVNTRLREYRKFCVDLKQYCDEQAKAIPKLKSAVDEIRGEVAILDRRLSEGAIAQKNRQRDEWEKTIRDVIAEVKAGNYANLGRAGGVRDALAEPQDMLLSFSRRAVKNIRQAAAAIDTTDADVVKFVSHVRDMCHAVSRNRHIFEGQ